MAEGTTMAAVDAELDKVLRPLTGLSLYRANVFRITGLSVDATPAQVRRRRDEAAMEARFGASAQRDDTAPWQRPETGAETLRDAFEALRDPVLRLTHELLWLRPDVEDGHPHNHAVRRHGEMLQREADDPDWEDGDEEARLIAWEDGLDAWAAALAVDDTWERARRRVREIDDPRLTLATVRRLRDRLPELIVGVNVSVAVRAVRDGDIVTAERHLEVLEECDFPETVVRSVERESVRFAETRIEAACEELARRRGREREEGLAPLHRMLTDVEGPLLVLTTVLNVLDPLTEAMSDRVAGSVNGYAVDYFNETRDGAGALPMLRRAAELARDQDVSELAARNVAVVEEEVNREDALVTRFTEPEYEVPEVHGELPAVLAEMCRRGEAPAAAARLRAWRRWTRDPLERSEFDRVVADPRALASPLFADPASDSIFFGVGLYGKKDLRVYGRDGGEPTHDELVGMRTEDLSFDWISTMFFRVLGIPLLPLGACLVREDWYAGRRCFGRVPLGAVARWYRLLVLLALPVAVVALFYGVLVAGLTAAALAGVTAVFLGLRQLYLFSWCRRHELSDIWRQR